MSMSNNSYLGGGGGGFGRFQGGGNAKDILSRSIMEMSMTGKGNTSIMDLATGHSAPSMKEIANRSMSISKPLQSSFIASQKSFFSKKPNQIIAKAQEEEKKDNIHLLDDDSFSSDSEGGAVKKVEAFSDEDSDMSNSEDCVVETKQNIKSTGFFQKQRLRDIIKKTGKGKVDIFREGESEEYNSEVDGDISIEDAGINYDILDVKKGENKIHQPLLDLITRYEELPEDFENMLTFENKRKALQRDSDEKWRERVEAAAENANSDDESVEKEPRPKIGLDDLSTRDFLTSDQCFIFSDELTIFDQKIMTCIFTIVDQKVYIMFKDSMINVYTPFDLEELGAIVMSPSNPMSAAFRMKQQDKLNRSHIIFQNQNMGLLIRFIQELEAHWLSVEFSDQIAMVIDKKPISFNFKELTIEKQKDQNDGLVNSAAQGYLFKKRVGFSGFWKNMFDDDNWDSAFYVLTNVGILVFEEDNFSNPSRLIALSKLTVEPISQKNAGKPFAFKITVDEEEEMMLRAPDKPQFESWIGGLRRLISEVKKNSANFKIIK